MARRLLRARLGLVLMGALLVSVSGLATTAAAAQTKLSVAWFFVESHSTVDGLQAAAEEFGRLHPDVEFEFIWEAGFGPPEGRGSQRWITMMAGGVIPDVVMGGTHRGATYADLLVPLNRYVERSGMDRSQFVPAAWESAQWRGDIYAIPLSIDPNFALIWNKDHFAEAGLDEEKGPETVAEWRDYFAKLTRTNPTTGELTRIGSRPWDVYGLANTVYSWGWIFGGSFYDVENIRVTAAHPAVVEALEFVREYHEQYASRIARETSLGSGFIAGTDSMRFSVFGGTTGIMASHPQIRLGIGRQPRREGSANQYTEWISGWGLGIAQGAREPDLAWEFIRFMTASPEGTSAYVGTNGLLSGYLQSPAHLNYIDDPIMSVYLQIAQTAPNWRPGIPVTAEYDTLLGQALTDVLAGAQQPRDALLFVEASLQRKLDEVLGR